MGRHSGWYPNRTKKGKGETQGPHKTPNTHSQLWGLPPQMEPFSASMKQLLSRSPHLAPSLPSLLLDSLSVPWTSSSVLQRTTSLPITLLRGFRLDVERRKPYSRLGCLTENLKGLRREREMPIWCSEDTFQGNPSPTTTSTSGTPSQPPPPLGVGRVSYWVLTEQCTRSHMAKQKHLP